MANCYYLMRVVQEHTPSQVSSNTSTSQDDLWNAPKQKSGDGRNVPAVADALAPTMGLGGVLQNHKGEFASVFNQEYRYRRRGEEERNHRRNPEASVKKKYQEKKGRKETRSIPSVHTLLPQFKRCLPSFTFVLVGEGRLTQVYWARESQAILWTSLQLFIFFRNLLFCRRR